MLTTHEEFQITTGISKGITEEKTLRYRKDAETYDLPTLLSGNLIKEIRGLNSEHVDYVADVDYLTGQNILFEGEIYDALQDSNGMIPGIDTEYWLHLPLYTVRYVLLKEFLIWTAYKNLLIEHGTSITEAGLTVPNDPEATYQQSSDTRRAVLIQRATDKANFHRRQIEAYLSKHELVTRNSCEPTRRRGNGRITAL